MLRINPSQSALLRSELLFYPHIPTPAYELTQADDTKCLSDNELKLLILILKQPSGASDFCLKSSFEEFGIDELTYKRTKWSLLLNRKLIECNEEHRFFFAPSLKKTNEEMKKSSGATDPKTTVASSPFSVVSSPGFFYPDAFQKFSSTDCSDGLKVDPMQIDVDFNTIGF